MNPEAWEQAKEKYKIALKSYKIERLGFAAKPIKDLSVNSKQDIVRIKEKYTFNFGEDSELIYRLDNFIEIGQTHQSIDINIKQADLDELLDSASQFFGAISYFIFDIIKKYLEGNLRNPLHIDLKYVNDSNEPLSVAEMQELMPKFLERVKILRKAIIEGFDQRLIANREFRYPHPDDLRLNFLDLSIAHAHPNFLEEMVYLDVIESSDGSIAYVPDKSLPKDFFFPNNPEIRAIEEFAFAICVMPREEN